MKRRFSYTLAASSLVEMLIVIIVSGILFIALFDGVNLVRRYTNRLNKTLAAGNSLLDSYQQLDHLFLSCDSVTAWYRGSFCFYKGGERLASRRAPGFFAGLYPVNRCGYVVPGGGRDPDCTRAGYSRAGG